MPFRLKHLSPFLFLFGGGALAVTYGFLPSAIARPLVVAGFHGGLMAGAFAAAWGEGTGWRRPAWLLAGPLFLASLFAQITPWGALAYLALPLALWILAGRDRRLRRIGLAWPGQQAWWLGIGVGLFLGGHLIFSASRTLGYPMRLTPPSPVLAALAYDLGANVLSAELFFRGALFNFWNRRRGFWAAAGLSTGACLIRYLADPALPRTPELTLGAVFYLTLLSLAGCGLLSLSGSVLPASAAGLLFFSAYRTLRIW